MIPVALAALRTGRFWLKAAPWIGCGLALLAIVLWIRGMQATIADQRRDLAKVSADLTAERVARKRDVAGLTALTNGLAQVAIDTRADRALIQETVRDANVPLPPQLGALLDGLRRQQAAGPLAAPARADRQPSR